MDPLLLLDREVPLVGLLELLTSHTDEPRMDVHEGRHVYFLRRLPRTPPPRVGLRVDGRAAVVIGHPTDGGQQVDT